MENVNDKIVIYQNTDGKIKLEVRIEYETFWLIQQQMVDLYMSSKSIVSEHIKHIFDEGELDKKEVVRKFRTTAGDGKNHSVTYYNFGMIISLGYRIKSVVATRFRRWDNQNRVIWAWTIIFPSRK